MSKLDEMVLDAPPQPSSRPKENVKRVFYFESQNIYKIKAWT